MSLKSKVYEFVVRVKQSILPVRIQEGLADVFFAHLPIWVIKALTVEYAGYLANYLPKKGDIVVDAGAWKGHFTVITSRLVGEEGTIVALEPQKDIYNKLVNRLNRLQIRNVILLNQGLSDKDTSKVVPKKKNASSFSVISSDEDSECENECIILGKLDTILSEIKISKVDFIKMDIEGAEIKALLGAHDTLSRSDVHLAVASYHIVGGQRTYAQVEQVLNSYGYEAVTDYPIHLTTFARRRSNS